MKKSSSFSGSLGFVLAAAGSAVGVGNIWRFPYLCAKDGGGLFLLVYLVLVLTFGFALLTTDVAIGRRTKQNALNAFATLNKKWRFLGYLTFLVPTLIMTYYSVIGGWITKYFALYLFSDGSAAAQDSFFPSFIPAPRAAIAFRRRPGYNGAAQSPADGGRSAPSGAVPATPHTQQEDAPWSAIFAPGAAAPFAPPSGGRAIAARRTP